MDNQLKEERKNLVYKKKLIVEEIDYKEKRLVEQKKKLSDLNKEFKGTYNVEKESLKTINSSLEKNIKDYEEAVDNPYFGRIDFKENKKFSETIYIGKRGISNSKQVDEIVVDWRAPVADLYYSGTSDEAYYKSPGGIIEGKLELKRKFLFNEGNIEKIFDEAINEIIVNGEEGKGLVDEFLKVNLETNSGKKLKEVVATIQKEQNEIIRWPKNLPIIVQGSAGSGKTTIALHRLAYLIYRYSESLKGEDILVLAPNKLFLDYISDILPSLDANQVKQNTFENLMVSKLNLKQKVYNKDEKLKDMMEEKDNYRKKLIINSSKVKSTIIYKIIIERYIKLVENKKNVINDIWIENEILFSKKEIIKLYINDLKYYPINKRKNEIKNHLQLKLKERIEETLNGVDDKYYQKILEVKKNYKDDNSRRKMLIRIYDERDEIKQKIKKNAKKELNKYFKNWENIKSEDLYYNFFNDEELFEKAVGGKIPSVLAQFMKDEFNKNIDDNIVDEDDLAPLYYIKLLIDGIDDEEKFKHIVVDEVQDYSPFQISIINKLCIGDSLTLVGDLAQGIYYYKGINSWESLIKEVFDSNATYVELTQSYRSTVEILDFAAKALNAQNLGLKECKPVLRHGEVPKIIEIKNKKDYAYEIDKIIGDIKNNNKNTVAIITKDMEEAHYIYNILKKKSKYSFEFVNGKDNVLEEDFFIIPSYLTKGLEFDATIILNPSEKNYKENLLDERLLYVSLTRALHMEFIIKEGNMTSLI